MAIEATISKFKLGTLKIYIAIAILFAAWCIYDGYFNEEWIQEHTEEDGTPEPYLVFNKSAPAYLIGFAVLCAVNFFIIKDKKIIADEDKLTISDKLQIPYDSIEKLDKTYFESKGHFTITYNDAQGKEKSLKISDKKYDNLNAILDEIVAKIS